MTDEENTKKDGWHWGEYGCEFYDGVFATPEKALAAAKLTLKKETKIFVVYAEFVEIKPSDFMVDMLDEINNSCANSYHNYNCERLFRCSREEIESFDIALKTAADKWQKDHDLKFSYFKEDESSKENYLVNPETSVVRVLPC